MNKKEEVLQVKDLKTHFFTDEGVSKAVDGLNFSVSKGETLGIVGESGCGKSITSLSIMRLIDRESGSKIEGSILFKGKDLLQQKEAEMRAIRGNQISMIFQEPMTSLNPVYSVGEQIAEAIRIHQKLNKKEAWNKAVDMLKLVGIPSPEKRAKQEPHELSGGMRQRIMIAMALACNPDLLIADEPTTALDVTIQAQILSLMKSLQKQLGMGIIMITHDLGVVSETCDRVAVMYAGKIVEYADIEHIFTSPKHPYTIGLLQSLPRLDTDQEELQTIPGSVPSPELQLTQDGSEVRCWMFTDLWDKSSSEKLEVL
ncbi:MULTISPECIES: ABC transporter ATP-binding protein [unclassified Bacillus (in: firmicutes)]|uniref:ABC transporter ATP-binding protein n=1 Tax=unclassified Bacillus (in: firmicutes) TaxID=185979 RepID=UPI0023DC5F43|nr:MULTISPECIES: ABC transporter ATP-binding protein [unclassified Bacillus (in: firmicutes)]MCU0095255.1 ABC transporter ATP-binding protein [Bacillus sp. OR9]MDF2017720.1 ABC transporter ATP-binding protein [Bacillus sp. Cr_R3]MDF2030422.1 ABC transporter ATP-binding protein [Bacillus sp. Cr_R16]